MSAAILIQMKPVALAMLAVCAFAQIGLEPVELVRADHFTEGPVFDYEVLCAGNRAGLSGSIGKSVLPEVMRSASIFPVTGDIMMPFLKWPAATYMFFRVGTAPTTGFRPSQ